MLNSLPSSLPGDAPVEVHRRFASLVLEAGSFKDASTSSSMRDSCGGLFTDTAVLFCSSFVKLSLAWCAITASAALFRVVTTMVVFFLQKCEICEANDKKDSLQHWYMHTYMT